VERAEERRAAGRQSLSKLSGAAVDETWIGDLGMGDGDRIKARG
jgi:hypothetical protein